MDGGASYPQFAMVVLHLRTVPSSAARCFAPADFASLRVLGASAASRPPINAVLPCSLGLFRAVSPTGRALRAPPPLPSSIRNGRSASSHRPRLRRCGVPWLRTALRFVCSPLQPFGPPMCGPPLLIGLTTTCFRHRRRPSCAPLQFPLKSYGFPGAETAKKRFLLWKMGFSGAKIAPSPPYTPPGTIKARKGFGSTIRHGRSASSHHATFSGPVFRCCARRSFSSPFQKTPAHGFTNATICGIL